MDWGVMSQSARPMSRLGSHTRHVECISGDARPALLHTAGMTNRWGIAGESGCPAASALGMDDRIHDC
jgi:hypothetical protein